jgi:cell shape-determining protein MreD
MSDRRFIMKKVKQILAILGIVVLLSLYVITLVCAIVDNSNTMRMFQASIVASFIIPVLIWAYSFVYKMVKKNHEQKED